MDDLSYALALYRGHNLFAFHGPVRNDDLTKESSLTIDSLCITSLSFIVQEPLFSSQLSVANGAEQLEIDSCLENLT